MADNVLTRKYGPLPGWAWAGAVVGGLGLAYWMNRSGTGIAAEAEGVDETEGGLYGSDLAEGEYLPPTQYPINAPGAGTYTPPASITTNEEWLTVANAGVRAQLPGASALVIDTALRQYLDGEPLTDQQSGIIELALRLIGPPPEGVTVPPPGEAPNPDPPTTGAPAIRWHSTTPQAVRSAFSVQQVAAALAAIGQKPLPVSGTSYIIDYFDIWGALRKLGYKNVPKTVAVMTVSNVAKVVNQQKASGSAGSPKPPTSGKGSSNKAYYRWHSSVPKWFREDHNAYRVVQALRRVRKGPRTRHVTLLHVRNGLRALGYKKRTNIRLDSRKAAQRNVGRLLAGRKARKGE